MLMKILKAFPYAHDHHTVAQLQADTFAEIDEGVLEGLFAEGYIAEPTDEELEALQQGEVVVMAAPIAIPDDWKALPWFSIQKLARSLGAPVTVNKATAIALIEAHQAERA